MNITERLEARAERLPDKAALVWGEQRLTYAEVNERVGRAAAALQGLGLGPGERVALMVGNTPRFVEALYGALRAGLVVVPINVGFTADEVEHILRDAGARAIVVTEPFVAVVDAVLGALDTLEHVLVIGAPEDVSGHASWRALLDAAGTPEPVALEGDALALLQYTSGTTGKPKGAMLTHANLLANQEQMGRTRLRVEEVDVVLCTLPLFHIYGLNVGLAFSLSRGASVVLVERFDAQATLELIQRERVSVVVGAPPMYIAWLNTPGVEDYDLASVRVAISGAAPLPRTVLRHFLETVDLPIWEGYGLTETAPVLTTTAMGDAPLAGSVGKPVPGVELRIVNARGEPVQPGDPGEVIARGPNVFRGYWQDAAATAEVLAPDGWFSTGDVGYQDDDGNLYLVDRKKDLIIVSGFNVYPREVEEVLYRHPKIVEAAAIGVPHPYSGEAVKAVVVLREGEDATADEVIDFARRSLARFKCPEVVEFASELPLLPTGKVKRRALRAS